MDIILVPGLWLDGGSWNAVVPILEEAGHHVHPLTLPGMESPTADRSRVTLSDHVAAVVAAIDAAREPGKVVLVGHSAGAAIAWAAVDARPERVRRAILIGGFPTADGDALVDGLAAHDGEVPMPEWSVFDESEVVGLDDTLREEFRRRAIPSPEGVIRGPQRLVDERRYDVPVTVVCPEFTSEMLKGWIAEDLAPVRELSRIRSVDFVDLPTGHWPQFTRPRDLATTILTHLDPVVDEHGRSEPPMNADEIGTLLGFLDYQRQTLAWKCSGVSAEDMRTTIAASTMTLGGLLKHMALVEEAWFWRRLWGRDRQPPWDVIDWDADPDWEWHSAADDTPEELFALWRSAVERSRALTADALASGGLGQRARWVAADGWSPSLRWILVHMIEEYARHNGHADLLREAIDGETGE
jgi:pimeloyl-ACP methyl ester carboxylesterase/uncharacterized damage-inducible protein DinB